MVQKNKLIKATNVNISSMGHAAITSLNTHNMVEALLLPAPERWLLVDCVIQYQALFLAHPRVQFEKLGYCLA